MRLAVALRLPADVTAAVGRLPRPPVPGVTWALPARWLVTLRPLGHVDLRLAPALAAALDDELAGAEPVECVLGPATVRLGGQWLGVPVAGLAELGAAVFAATEPLVPVTHPQPFRADLVLARGRVPAGLAGEPLAARWVAGEVALVADRSAPGRPRLEDLAVVPLTGSPTPRR